MNLSKAFDRSNRKFLTENVDTYSLSNDTLKLLYGQTAFDKNQADIYFIERQKQPSKDIHKTRIHYETFLLVHFMKFSFGGISRKMIYFS